MPKEKPSPQLNFQGFHSPNFTSVPDDVFDVLLPHLSGSELKVLLYIIRRTFGFKKSSDSISLSQMLHGITTREGTVLDRGTGVAKQALLRALRSLQEKNIIRSVRQRSEGRGNEPTIYSLVMAAETLGMKVILPLVSKSDQGAVPESDHGVGAEITPGPRTDFQPTQETGVQETEEQNTVRQQQQDAVDALTEFGIDKSTSNFLIKNHSEAYILEKIGHVRWMQAANQNSLKNPPGFLRRAIEDDWPAPPGYTTTQEAEIVDDCSICDGTGWMPMDSIQVHCDHTGEPSPLADLPPESG